ncbi:hypothetical protein LOC68_17750 [Blastopirellula sp. JC732]|uniref:Uncharacterized protein n=1 Tax=Blastopirellula sediminis TaxID=2894196 RepID=A0A9X1MPU5_9BACT|nr:hypothetical protein [Blastopirellula sediminis]MCC9606460.1 hypothetical protein [Blastopirellula sediminis]MCC9630242.1 hypothetical protein [Blastopirellula sediminis]
MATDSTHELQQFHQFIGERLASGAEMSVAEAVAEFQHYQAELERLRVELQPGLERMQQGEFTELDAEAVKRRAHERWQSRSSGENA